MGKKRKDLGQGATVQPQPAEDPPSREFRFSEIARSIVHNPVSPIPVRDVADTATKILRGLSGRAKDVISHQTANHWVPKAGVKPSRLPANRDQAWAFALALLHLRIARTGGTEEVKRDARAMIMALDYRPLPPWLLDAAMERTEKPLLNLIERYSEFGHGETDVLATLEWLLEGTTDDQVHAILCVAALSPPKVINHRETLSLITDFVKKGGCYLMCVPFHAGVTEGRPSLIEHYREILDQATKTVPYLQRGLDADAKKRVRLIGVGKVAAATSAVRLIPPLAGVEARPVLLRTESLSESGKQVRDKLACLVTEDHQDQFLKRFDSLAFEGNLAEDTRRKEWRAVSDYFDAVLSEWANSDYTLKDLALTDTQWMVLA